MAEYPSINLAVSNAVSETAKQIKAEKTAERDAKALARKHNPNLQPEPWEDLTRKELEELRDSGKARLLAEQDPLFSNRAQQLDAELDEAVRRVEEAATMAHANAQLTPKEVLHFEFNREQSLFLHRFGVEKPEELKGPARLQYLEEIKRPHLEKIIELEKEQ